jgi:tRNA pseudouridine38-40 synthase
MMTRIKCKVSYDGTNYCGFQVQPNDRTVQGLIELALKKIHKGEIVRIFASGRTDSGVHALGQVFHFDTQLQIPAERWVVALNTILPDDISILEADEVSPDFHARYDVQMKEYRYRVFNRKHADVFRRNYALHIPYHLDVQLMKKVLREFIGTHDFSSFCGSKSDKVDKVRTIYEADLIENDDELIFRFVGNGFLFNMVRIIVGTCLMVGNGKIQENDIISIINKRDRTFAGKTSAAHGLYLWDVYYDNES